MITAKKTVKISVGLVYCDNSELTKAIRIVNSLNTEERVNSKTKIIIDIKGICILNSIYFMI